MILFGRREAAFARLTQRYAQLTGEILRGAGPGGQATADNGSDDTVMLQQQAEAVRQEAEAILQQGAFLPFFREDYLLLLRQVAALTDRVRIAGSFLAAAHAAMPAAWREALTDITQATCGAAARLAAVLPVPDQACGNRLPLIQEIDRENHAVMRGQCELSDRLQRSILALPEKLLLQRQIDYCVEISASVAQVVDRALVMAAKQRV